ncbi:MAG: acyl-CoA dehydrogenase [Deltaproteobacteria bacterium]|nr:acyl-CoA dehydrogenase [Candidatus Zymogenaceae bacterium]
MSNLIMDMRDARFVLYEQLGIDKLCERPRYADHSKDVFEMVLDEAEKMAVNYIEPTYVESDKIGAVYDPKTKAVTTPPSFKKALEAYKAGGWIAMAESPEVGGQGLPYSLYMSCMEIFVGSNFAFIAFPGLSHGSARMIEVFGTEEQKNTYLYKMYEGQWLGTMCLTEPGAGSEVGALKTKATANPDGTWSIVGNKTFITSGEHDLSENIIHMVLARIEGDPPGTKGISIFIVPKFIPKADGSIGEPNDLYCAGIEEKMGIHGSPTTQLVFGDNGKCVGYLLGDRMKGMKIMFMMMNEERMFVGLQGLSTSSAAYLHAVKYAKERVQGVHYAKIQEKDSPSVPIIQHPDVRRMLTRMKAYVEGMRGLQYYMGYCIDNVETTEGAEKARWQGLLDLLIPICKGYETDMVWDITGQAIQVYGGYGFTRDYPVEQYARDCKIASLYEGTNGIQAMDFTFRKMLLNGLVNFGFFKEEVKKVTDAADKVADLKPYAAAVKKALAGMEDAVDFQQGLLGKGKMGLIFGNAVPLMELMGDLVIAWQLLWQMNIAYPKLGGLKGEELAKKVADSVETAFYAGKVSAAKYYIGSLLPRVSGKVEQLKSEEDAYLEIADGSFAF